MIQFNVGLLDGEDLLPHEKRYRDPETEGYNITPNFFIRGKINFGHLNDRNDNLQHVPQEENGSRTMCQFPNRLFDRDTLLLETYNINFLYVLESYISRGDSAEFRRKARSIFRKDLLRRINERYDFYLIRFASIGEMRTFVSQYFRRLIGKMYRTGDNAADILLAFEKGANTPDVAAVMTELGGKLELQEHGIPV